MAIQTKLINMTHVMPELGAPHMGNEEIVAWLEANLSPEAEYFTQNLGTKGGKVMMRPEDVEALKVGNWTFGRRRREGKVRIIEELPAPAAPASGLQAWQADMETRMEQLETMFLDTDARVDQLHKAVEGSAKVYADLRDRVDQSVMQMPEAAPLPPRFKWKILVAGGTPRMHQRIRDQFKTVDFRFIEPGMRKGFNRLVKPHVEVAFIMTDFVPHEIAKLVQRWYPDARLIAGGVGGIEAVISLWLHEREEERR